MGSTARGCGRGHGTAAEFIASVDKLARTSTGYAVTDYAATEAKRGWPPLWKRPRDCRGGRRLCGQGRADSRRVRPREQP